MVPLLQEIYSRENSVYFGSFIKLPYNYSTKMIGGKGKIDRDFQRKTNVNIPHMKYFPKSTELNCEWNAH